MRSLRPQPDINPDAPTAPHHSPSQHAKLVCPYCGGITHLGTRCELCRGPLDPLSRQATQNTMGPWFIRDESNPFRPGCSYETMKSLIERRRVGPDTIVRGPTTRQFWCAARRARGLAHLLGHCPDCGADVNPADTHCDECSSEFVIDNDRQALGLAPLVALPGQSIAEHTPASTNPFARTPITAASQAEAHEARTRDVERTQLASARDSVRWLTLLAAFLFFGVLGLGFLVFRAEWRSTTQASPNLSPPAELPPSAPSQHTPSPHAAAIPAQAPAAAATTPDPQLPPRAPFDAELDRAKRLLTEGTHDSVSQALALAEAANHDSAEWRAVKQLAERRLAQLKLRSVR